MKKAKWIFCMICIIVLNSCREDINTTEVTVIQPEPEVNVISDMRGIVLDENDNPVTSALVTVNTESTFTNEKGEYSFNEIVANQGKEQIIVQKNNHFTKATKINNQAEGASYSKVTLLAHPQGITVNTNQSEAFSITGDASMVFSPNSLRRQDGSIYEGEAIVKARYLNPDSGDFSRQMMSELVGLDKEGNPKALRPLGMLNLQIETTSGELLEINKDVGIELEFPLPEDEDNQNEDIPSWIYDLEAEFWLEDVDCYQVTQGNYGCTIYTTGPWACCMPVEGVGVSLDVFNSDMTPASFVKVEFEDNNSYFHFGSYTNSNGQVQGTLPADNVYGFGLTVQDLCDNIVYEELNAGPYATDTNLPDIILDVVVEQFMINVQGTALDCIGTGVGDGWINVRYPGYEKNFAVNPDGSFDFDVHFNCISFPDMEVTAYDANGEQASETVYHNQLSDFETGILTTCENLSSSLEITVGGNTALMFPAVYDQVWSEPTDSYIQSELPGGKFYLRFENYDGSPGIYIGELTITNEDGILPDLSAVQGEGQSLSVEITMDDGEYIEGEIIGMIDDGNGNMAINVPFRAKKKL